MNERVVWSGDHNPLTEEALTGVQDIWIRGGDYTAVPKGDVCYVAWGKKPVMSFAARKEPDGVWSLVMGQNPNMGPFPDKVMDNFEKILSPITRHLTREAHRDEPKLA